jgi:hypothetical protein
MKKILIKRLVYTCGRTGEEFIGATEYNGKLSDDNILGAIHEVGKTQWIGESLWLMRNGVPFCRITVEAFPQYTKSWLDLLIDAVRRI